jgi:hypothetical protein
MVAHASSATSEKGFVVAGLVIVSGSKGIGRGKQACRMVTRRHCSRHKNARERTQILERCFCYLVQSQSKTQQVGRNLPLLVTPQSNLLVGMVGMVGLPSSVPVK